MNETIPWQKRGMGINWALIQDGKTIATLVSNGLANSLFSASCNNIYIKISKIKHGGYTFVNSEDKKIIGTMDVPFLCTSFHFHDGRDYKINGNGNLWYFSNGSRNLAVTRYIRGGLSIKAEITQLDCLEDDPDFGVIAIATLLTAIFDSAFLS
jgi:hypothetical protein